MARGANTKPQPYILEGDRHLQEEEQTVWWIKCKNTVMGNETLQRYTRAQRQNIDGSSEFDTRKLQLADKEDFLEFCVKVENWYWSDEYKEKHPNVVTNDLGYTVDPITDPEELANLVSDLSVGDFNELAAAANNQVRLNRGLKKS